MEISKKALLQLSTDEGNQWRKTDEGRMDIESPYKGGEAVRKAPNTEAFVCFRKNPSGINQEGDLVLDLFNGSGTTGIACEMLKRKYIGIDKEKDYLDLTIRRYFKRKEK